jgi:hypothetical protein
MFADGKTHCQGIANFLAFTDQNWHIFSAKMVTVDDFKPYNVDFDLLHYL